MKNISTDKIWDNYLTDELDILRMDYFVMSVNDLRKFHILDRIKHTLYVKFKR